MSSIKERMEELKRIVIESDEQCVIEIHHKGRKVSELVFSVIEIESRLLDGKSNVKTAVINYNGFGEQETTTIKYSNE